MSTSMGAAAVPAADDRPTESVDLTVKLAPLSREDLELFIVQSIARYPALYNNLTKLLVRPVNADAIQSSLETLIKFSHNLSDVTGELETYCDQATDFAKARHSENALAIASAVTRASVDAMIKAREGNSEEDDEYRLCESFCGQLEGCWQEVLDSVAIDTDSGRALVQGQLTLLAEWQSKLTPVIGPVFSDPIRATRKRLKTQPAPTGDGGGKDEAEKPAAKKARH